MSNLLFLGLYCDILTSLLIINKLNKSPTKTADASFLQISSEKHFCHDFCKADSAQGQASYEFVPRNPTTRIKLPCFCKI